MNTMRTISRVLVVAITFVGSASAMNGSHYATKVYDAVGSSDSVKARIVFAHIGENQLAKNNHAGKASVDTLGYVIDKMLDSEKKKSLDIVVVNKDIAKHFITNYAIRVASDRLDKAGINSESAAKAVANLSGGLVDKSKAQTAIEYVTHPEVLVLVGGILYGMIPSINASTSGQGTNIPK